MAVMATDPPAQGTYKHDICCCVCNKVLFKAKDPMSKLRLKLKCAIEVKCKCGHLNRLPGAVIA